MAQTISPTATTKPVWQERLSLFYQKRRQAVEAWIILTPILIYYFFFAILPVIGNLLVSFVDWNGFNDPTWVGLSNFQRFFTNPRYLDVLANTAFFAVTILLISTALGLMAALALNEKVRGLSIFRTFWYVPTLTSAAIMAQIATIFIAPGSGVLSSILQSIDQREIIWQVDVNFTRTFIIAFSVWRGVGFAMLLYLAGLQNISAEVLDAARVDGAHGWALLRLIKLPLLRPTTVFVIVSGLINAFQIFEPVLLITNGQPRNTTNVMLLQIYNDAFRNQNFGMAAASATIMLLLLLGASILNLRLLRETGTEETYNAF